MEQEMGFFRPNFYSCTAQDLDTIKRRVYEHARNITEGISSANNNTVKHLKDVNVSVQAALSNVQKNLREDLGNLTAAVKDLLKKADVSKLEKDVILLNEQLRQKDAFIATLSNTSSHTCPPQHPTTGDGWWLYLCTTEMDHNGIFTQTCSYRESVWLFVRLVQWILAIAPIANIFGSGCVVCFRLVRPHKIPQPHQLGGMPRPREAHATTHLHADPDDRARVLMHKFLKIFMEGRIFGTMMETDRKVTELVEERSIDILNEHLLSTLRDVSTQLSATQNVHVSTIKKLAVLVDLLKDLLKRYEYFCTQTMPDYEKCQLYRQECLALVKERRTWNKTRPDLVQTINQLRTELEELKKYRPGWIDGTQYPPDEVVQVRVQWEDVQFTAQQISTVLSTAVRRERLTAAKRRLAESRTASNIQMTADTTEPDATQQTASNIQMTADTTEPDATQQIWRQLGIQNVVAGEVQDRCVRADAAALEGSAVEKTAKSATWCMVLKMAALYCCLFGLIGFLYWTRCNNNSSATHPMCMQADEFLWKAWDEKFWRDLKLSFAAIFFTPASPNITS
jgi:hypothetical protein